MGRAAEKGGREERKGKRKRKEEMEKRKKKRKERRERRRERESGIRGLTGARSATRGRLGARERDARVEGEIGCWIRVSGQVFRGSEDRNRDVLGKLGLGF